MYARIILIGLLHHQRNLSTQKEKDEFKEYKVQSVESHIQHPQDKHMCRMIIDSLPSYDMGALITFGQSCSAAVVETMLLNHDPAARQALYVALKPHRVASEWFQVQTRALMRAESARIYDICVPIIRARLETALNEARDLEREMQDPAERRRSEMARDALKLQVNNAVDAFTSVTDRAMIGAPAHASDVTAEIAENAQNAYGFITTFETGLRAPRPAAQPAAVP